MYTIKFAKLREGAVIPSKRDEDSDYDLYACFEGNMRIEPFSTALVPTGIISAFPKELGVKFEERGSNTKWCGIVQAGVIDSGYRDEWFAAIYNGNPLPVIITREVEKVIRTDEAVYVPYSKAVCQFHVRRIEQVEIVEESVEDIRAVESQRGLGKLGSSGK